MEYLLSNLPHALIVLGLILLAIEVLVLGFSTFFLFFIGLGLLITGLFIAFGLIPENLFHSLFWTGFISVLIALVSWKPLKRMQDKVDLTRVNNDLIGYCFILTEELPIGDSITYKFSGIDWQVKAKEHLSKDTEVKIINMEVGVLTVEAVSK